MAVLNMRYDGDEILRKKCKEVKEVDDRNALSSSIWEPGS